MTATATTPNGDLLDVRIRRSTEADARALERLAQLDGAPPPAGAYLVAEEGGKVRAALPIEGGPPIADPFHRTLELVAMLSLRSRPPARVARTRRRRRLRLPARRIDTSARQALVPRPGHS
jgi:hypothetical protein